MPTIKGPSYYSSPSSSNSFSAPQTHLQHRHSKEAITPPKSSPSPTPSGISKKQYTKLSHSRLSIKTRFVQIFQVVKKLFISLYEKILALFQFLRSLFAKKKEKQHPLKNESPTVELESQTLEATNRNLPTSGSPSSSVLIKKREGRSLSLNMEYNFADIEKFSSLPETQNLQIQKIQTYQSSIASNPIQHHSEIQRKNIDVSAALEKDQAIMCDICLANQNRLLAVSQPGFSPTKNQSFLEALADIAVFIKTVETGQSTSRILASKTAYLRYLKLLSSEVSKKITSAHRVLIFRQYAQSLEPEGVVCDLVLAQYFSLYFRREIHTELSKEIKGVIEAAEKKAHPSYAIKTLLLMYKNNFLEADIPNTKEKEKEKKGRKIQLEKKAISENPPPNLEHLVFNNEWFLKNITPLSQASTAGEICKTISKILCSFYYYMRLQSPTKEAPFSIESCQSLATYLLHLERMYPIFQSCSSTTIALVILDTSVPLEIRHDLLCLALLYLPIKITRMILACIESRGLDPKLIITARKTIETIVADNLFCFFPHITSGKPFSHTRVVCCNLYLALAHSNKTMSPLHNKQTEDESDVQRAFWIGQNKIILDLVLAYIKIIIENSANIHSLKSSVMSQKFMAIALEEQDMGMKTLISTTKKLLSSTPLCISLIQSNESSNQEEGSVTPQRPSILKNQLLPASLKHLLSTMIKDNRN